MHLNTYSNNLSFKIQPTVQEHEELVLLAENLKLELIEYSRQLYGGEDDEDADNDDEEAFPVILQTNRQTNTNTA